MVDSPNSVTPSRGQACTLIYDADCRLCVAAKQRIEKAAEGRHPAKVRFIPYQTEEAAQRLGKDYVPGRPDVAFLIEPNGTIRKGLDAFLPLLPALKRGHLVDRLIQISWLKPLASL